jgi:hypothetical protein
MSKTDPSTRKGLVAADPDIADDGWRPAGDTGKTGAKPKRRLPEKAPDFQAEKSKGNRATKDEQLDASEESIGEQDLAEREGSIDSSKSEDEHFLFSPKQEGQDSSEGKIGDSLDSPQLRGRGVRRSPLKTRRRFRGS